MNQLFFCILIHLLSFEKMYGVDAAYFVQQSANAEAPDHSLRFGKSFLQQVAAFTWGKKAELSEDILENHGSIITYFKKKDSNHYIEGAGSGYLHASSIVTSAAHVFINTGEGKYGEYEIHCCKVLFFSKSGRRYEADSWYINPNYFDSRTAKSNPKKHTDTAVLYLQNSDVSQNPEVQFYDDGSFTKPHNINKAIIHAYTAKMNPNSSTNEIDRVEHHIEAECVLQDDELTDFSKANTFAGMSGANSFCMEGDLCRLISIHTAGNCEDEFSKSHIKHYLKGDRESKGVTLNNTRSAAYGCLSKQAIWRDLGSSIFSVVEDEWRPVLLSIQTDSDLLWQEKFMDFFVKKLQRHCEKHNVLYCQETLSKMFHFFALSGNTQSVMNKLSVKTAGISIQSQTQEILPDNSLFPEATSRDMTLEGIDKLQEHYPDNPAFVIALGVSGNSEEVHDKLNERVLDDFLYERVNYLQLPNESNQDYTQKIEFEADKIAELVVENYLLKYPVLSINTEA